MLRTTVGLLLLCMSGGIATAQGSAITPPMNADAMKWSAAPPVLPQGAQMSVISGDPSKDGLYVVRLKMPANYKIPAHSHPTTEYVTVISGSFHVGMGDKLDETKGQELKPADLSKHRQK
jgi:quercetin dioxygenase-like cupin family protein